MLSLVDSVVVNENTLNHGSGEDISSLRLSQSGLGGRAKLTPARHNRSLKQNEHKTLTYLLLVALKSSKLQKFCPSLLFWLAAWQNEITDHRVTAVIVRVLQPSCVAFARAA